MFVHSKPGVIYQYVRVTVVFHLDSHGGKSEIFLQGLDLFQREDDPEPSIDEVSEFVMEEIMMQDGRRVWPRVAQVAMWSASQGGSSMFTQVPSSWRHCR